MDLEEARELVQSQLDDGVTCPCCAQFCKRYRRKLNSGMAATLCWLVRWAKSQPRGAYVYVNKTAPRFVLRRGGEWTLLQHWGLIEEKPKDPDADERTSGRWRPTQEGVNFALQRTTVPSHVLTYNKGGLLAGDQVTIRTCLGNHFSYKELMGL